LAADRPPDRPDDRQPAEESEALVAATDAVVGVVALAALGGVLRATSRTSERGRSLRRAFGAFFGCVAVASFAGAALHGLYRDPASVGRRLLWKVSLGAIGASAAAGVDAAAALALRGTPAFVARTLAGLALAAWLVVIAVAAVPYRAVVALYAPALAVFGGALASRLRHEAERPTAAIGLLGLGLTVAAAIIQVTGGRVGPLGRNTLYHAVQAIGLAVLARSATGLIGDRAREAARQTLRQSRFRSREPAS
jgi:hypothetical protein